MLHECIRDFGKICQDRSLVRRIDCLRGASFAVPFEGERTSGCDAQLGRLGSSSVNIASLYYVKTMIGSIVMEKHTMLLSLTLIMGLLLSGGLTIALLSLTYWRVLWAQAMAARAKR
jgi:hypothetical protein